MTLPRLLIATAGLVLPLLLAASLEGLLLHTGEQLGAQLADCVPTSWRARAAAAAAEQEAGPLPELEPATELLPQSAAASDDSVPLVATKTARSVPGGINAPQASGPQTSEHQGSALHPQIPTRGLRVRKTVVLALSRTAAIPSASLVPASATRPAGLQLSGVGSLGVGVQDGDVLTHAAGQPLHSVAQVIGLVAGARHQRAAEVSGTLYRGDEAINLIVEMPYLKKARTAGPVSLLEGESARRPRTDSATRR